MPRPTDAIAADGLPPQETAGSGTQRSGWRLVADAPQPEAVQPRDRRGAARGMALLLVGGGLFWGAVAAAVALLWR